MNFNKKNFSTAKRSGNPSGRLKNAVVDAQRHVVESASERLPDRPTVTRWGRSRALQATVLAAAFTGAFAQTDPYKDPGPRYPTATAPAAPATSVRRSTTSTDVFTENAPDTYTIVRGDTLWGIAGRFLKQPWRWPEIWQMNRDQIRNPHWIYPGQVIELDRATGTMRLRGGPSANATIKLSPQVRAEANKDAIPSIPPEAIEPYLTQPLIVEEPAMRSAPRVVASKERVILGVGDIAYVAGITDPSIPVYQLFRPGRPLVDPDTGKVIAYQADYLGTGRVTRPGEPATISITSSKAEVLVGDRLVAATKPVATNYMPHAPSGPLSGRIVSTVADSGVAYAGVNMIVAINRGTTDGVDIGTVLAIKTYGRTIVDTTNGSKQEMTLPEERKGLMFIFRVFDHVSYGLITSSSDAVAVGDSVTQP
jgi:LysM domain